MWLLVVAESEQSALVSRENGTGVVKEVDQLGEWLVGPRASMGHDGCMQTMMTVAGRPALLQAQGGKGCGLDSVAAAVECQPTVISVLGHSSCHCMHHWSWRQSLPWREFSLD